MRRMLSSADDVVVGTHELTADELRVVDDLAALALARHRFEGAWSVRDRLLVVQVLDHDKVLAWEDGHYGALTYGWPGEFGASLSVTLYLHGTEANPQPLLSRSVIPQGDAFLEAIANGPVRIVLLHGKRVVRCDTLDYTFDETIYNDFLTHVAAVKNHSAGTYNDDAIHFWEVVKAQENLHPYLTASDRLSLGWLTQYKQTSFGAETAITMLKSGGFAAACNEVELSTRVRGLVEAIITSEDSRGVLEYFATCLTGEDHAWDFLKELEAIPDTENSNHGFSGVQVLLHQFLESPQWTDFGRQLEWMSIEGKFRQLRIEPRAFPTSVDPISYWGRRNGYMNLGLGYLVRGRDVFQSVDELRENAESLPTCDDAEDCYKQAEFLLAEANANKKGTIPPNAIVEMRIGRYTEVELMELGQNVFVVLRRDDSLIEFGAVEPSNGYFSFSLPDPDEAHSYDVDRVTASLKLLIAAIIRDFWIVEHRERVFSTREVRRERTDGRSDVGGVRVVYLPRVEYSPTERPNVEACAETLHTIERRAHFVAAHIRKSSSASLQQKRLAERYGIQLPEGYTFVKPHERGARKRDVIYRSRSALQSLYRAVESPSQPASVDWFRFERDVQGLMASLGFEVEHVAASKRGDQGVDVYATKGDDLEAVQWVIQCKCWRDKVGPGVVRELVGTLTRFSTGTRGMIITTSGFTTGAIAEAERHNIRLMNGGEFAERLRAAELDG